jgi:hypothetical protein
MNLRKRVIVNSSQLTSSKSSLFSAKIIEKEIDVTEMLKSVEKFLPPHLTQSQKLKLANQIKTIWDKDPSKIKDLGKQMQEMFKEKQMEAKSAKQSDGFGMIDFLKETMKLLASAKMGPLLMVASAAAQSISDLVVHADQPQAGMDLCSQALFKIGCAQGYITNGANPWTPSDPQFCRIISSAEGLAPDATTGYYKQLHDCLTIDSIGSSAANIYTNSTSGVTGSTATSTVWHGYQVQATVRGAMSTESSAAWQNDMQVKFQSCQSLSGAVVNAGIIAGSVIGAVAAVVLLAVAFVYCKDKCSNNNCVERTRLAVV